MSDALGPETIHATSVAINGKGVLLLGPSGAGKSDLALRLIDRGAILISDDYTTLVRKNDSLIANAPETIAGMLEIRHIGIVHLPHATDVSVVLAIRLEEKPERMPDVPAAIDVNGVALPLFALAGLEASAPIKVEYALSRLGIAETMR
jgi:serine kinase of HPr protein (carbohydrate metabolism regulator)